MTFREYVIQEKGLKFYELSLEQISMTNSTFTEWFSDLHTDWKIMEKFFSNKALELIGKEVVITDVVGGRNVVLSTPKIKSIPENGRVLLDNNETIHFHTKNHFENFLNEQATWIHPTEVLICVKS